MNNLENKEEQFRKLCEINRVEGFDPAAFAVEYTDMNTGEVRKRLPVMIQMAWFRLKYPEGRIAVDVTPTKDGFVARARIYPDYRDGLECYLAEATASRGADPAHPSVSPREWAQTAAVGVALRNAGFGLQFGAAGEDFSEKASQESVPQEGSSLPEAVETTHQVEEPSTEEPSLEEQLQRAMSVPCPISKYKGRTLGDMLTIDPGAIVWVANKQTVSPQAAAAAKLLCEYAQGQTTS